MERKKGYLVGASEKVEICNAQEFKIDASHLKEWKYTLNALLNKKKSKNFDELEYQKQLKQILEYILTKMEEKYLLYKDDVLKFQKIDLNNLKEEELEKGILELLNLLKCNSTTANLNLFNLSASFGRKKNLNINHGQIINKSITGIKEWKDEF